MQQLYMQIKRTSKYANQQSKKNTVYPVAIESGNGEYMVQGGPGGQYRMSDVNIFVKLDDGKFQKIGR